MFETKHNENVVARRVGMTAADGVRLTGHWLLPRVRENELSAVVVVAPGAGIPAAFYRRMARYVADRGAAVLTFDYRGIGESRSGSMRDVCANIEIWGRLDLGAALALAKAEYLTLPLGVIAHSIGCLLVGAAPGAQQISRLVFFAPHTAYWGDYGKRWRWLLYLTWHVFMPRVTKLVGYFPGRALHLGADLPKGLALDWAGRLTPGLMETQEYAHRFSAILGGYRELHARTLAISVADDAFAPPAAAGRLLAAYPELPAVHQIVRPSDLGSRRLGHMAFLGRAHGEFFWKRASAWLLQSFPSGGTGQDDPNFGLPLSGTKDRASSGSAAPSE